MIIDSCGGSDGRAVGRRFRHAWRVLDPDFVDAVLEIVERIPPGRVMAYGDIAEYLGRGGPRMVGRVMALHGGAVPWWRVVRADGSPVQGYEQEALRRLRAELVPVRASGARVDMSAARWHPPAQL
jgi:alkylated DNA nucleotide flippase Atl1